MKNHEKVCIRGITTDSPDQRGCFKYNEIISKANIARHTKNYNAAGEQQQSMAETAVKFLGPTTKTVKTAIDFYLLPTWPDTKKSADHKGRRSTTSAESLIKIKIKSDRARIGVSSYCHSSF